MRENENHDNLFREGEFIYAKEDPEKQLVITKYYQRIYYCTRVTDKKELVYFERELLQGTPKTVKL